MAINNEELMGKFVRTGMIMRHIDGKKLRVASMAMVTATVMVPPKATRATVRLKVMKATARMAKANAVTVTGVVTARASAAVVAARSACSRWSR